MLFSYYGTLYPSSHHVKSLKQAKKNVRINSALNIFEGLVTQAIFVDGNTREACVALWDHAGRHAADNLATTHCSVWTLFYFAGVTMATNSILAKNCIQNTVLVTQSQYTEYESVIWCNVYAIWNDLQLRSQSTFEMRHVSCG